MSGILCNSISSTACLALVDVVTSFTRTRPATLLNKHAGFQLYSPIPGGGVTDITLNGVFRYIGQDDGSEPNLQYSPNYRYSTGVSHGKVFTVHCKFSPAYFALAPTINGAPTETWIELTANYPIYWYISRNKIGTSARGFDLLFSLDGGTTTHATASGYLELILT